MFLIKNLLPKQINNNININNDILNNRYYCVNKNKNKKYNKIINKHLDNNNGNIINSNSSSLSNTQFIINNSNENNNIIVRLVPNSVLCHDKYKTIKVIGHFKSCQSFQVFIKKKNNTELEEQLNVTLINDYSISIVVPSNKYGEYELIFEFYKCFSKIQIIRSYFFYGYQQFIKDNLKNNSKDKVTQLIYMIINSSEKPVCVFGNDREESASDVIETVDIEKQGYLKNKQNKNDLKSYNSYIKKEELIIDSIIKGYLSTKALNGNKEVLDKNNNIMLMIAAGSNNNKAFRALVFLSSLNQKNIINQNIFHMICRNGSSKLMDSFTSNINSIDHDYYLKDIFGCNGAHYAVENGDLKFVRLLIKKFPNLFKMGDKYGLTPLHYAIQNSNYEMVKTILPKLSHFIIEVKDKNGFTPLHWAVLLSNLKIVELLLQYGSNVNSKDNNDETPIYKTIGNNSKDSKNIVLLIQSREEFNENINTNKQFKVYQK